MKESPILFSEKMVRAILAGKKSQTRRIVNPQPHAGIRESVFVKSGIEDGHGREIKSPYGYIGDILWVRESWQAQNTSGLWWHEVPRNDRPLWNWAFTNPVEPAFESMPPRWIPSIHMPRMACRIELEITELRIERLNNISEGDAIAEGCQAWIENGQATDTAISDYAHLWNEINLERGYSWESNPFVWVVSFQPARGLTKRAVDLGDSAAFQALSTPEVLSTCQADSTPAPNH